MREELARFQVSDAFWETLRAQGYDGYDCIEYAQKERWEAIPDWGKEKWLLGDWPIVIVFFRNRPGYYEVACYLEGEIEVYACPSKEIRNQITNELAFFHWKKQGEGWVAGLESVEQAAHLFAPRNA